MNSFHEWIRDSATYPSIIL